MTVTNSEFILWYTSDLVSEKMIQLIPVTKTIRVYNQGELSAQRRAFDNARDEVSLLYDLSCTKIIFEAKTITQTVNEGYTEDDFVTWLTEKDGCVCLCHPFQADFPPNWNYKYFLNQLRKVAEQKGVPIYPNPQDIENDPTFSQVHSSGIYAPIFLNSTCIISWVTSFYYQG